MFRELIRSFVDVLSPPHCVVCGSFLETNKTYFNNICGKCFLGFPMAPEPSAILNNIAKNFNYDDLTISNCYSLFSVNEKFEYIELIHCIKYEGFTKLGFRLGKELGLIVKNMKDIEYDAIIPVPLHKARKRERGFNQAEIISNGMSEILNLQINNKILKRKYYTQTQTLLSKSDRLTNVQKVFSLNKNQDIKNKKLLLVDDVLTTGSTLNSCASLLLENGAKRIDVATLAVA